MKPSNATPRYVVQNLFEGCSEGLVEGHVHTDLDNGGEPGEDVAGQVEVSVEAGGGVQDQDEVCREVADHVADEDGPDSDGEVDLLVSVVVLGFSLRLMPHNSSVNVPDDEEDLEVAEGNYYVGKGRYEYSVKVRKAVATNSGDDGTGSCN